MSATIESAVNFIQASTTPEQITNEVVPWLRKLDKSTKPGKASLLENILPDKTDPLAVIDPQASSAGYLFVLNARLGKDKQNLVEILPFVCRFVELLDPAQTRMVPDQVSFLARQLLALAEAQMMYPAIVGPLWTLMVRYTTPGHLSSLHPIFLQAVLSARLYQQAEPLLAYDIVEVDTFSTELRYQDHLLYHYLGGVITGLLGDYSRAAELLEICVSAPGPSASAIQIDAHKKLVLFQLLVHGKTQPLPRYTSSSVTQACKNVNAVYIDYADKYAQQNRDALRAASQKYHDAFEKDYNVGLVDLCEKAFRRRTIQKLTETYITQSLLEIANAVELEPTDGGLQELEQELVGMIATGEIFGTIAHGSLAPSQPTHDWAAVTITFTDDPEPYNSHRTVERVARAIAEASAFEKELAGNGRRVARSKEFVAKAYSTAGTTSGGAVMGADDAAFETWDGDFDEGEDL